MDISKYIIKFLIKNRFCSLPGLGSFTLEKISAAINTKEGEIKPAKFEITFSPLGTIDDTFASFVANHENVSISNTSNNIKEYCRAVKEEIAQQGKFTIPNLGFLTMQNGKITFVQTDELDMGAAALPLPPIDTNLKKNANNKLDFSYPAAHKAYKRKKVSVGKFMIPALVVLLLCIGAYVAYNYIKNNPSQDQPQETNNSLPLQQDTTTKQAQSLVDNSSTPTTQTTTSSNGSLPLYKVAILQTPLEATANARAAKWKKYGNLTEVQNVNGQFIVSILASHPNNDTTLLVDSLRRFFNPKGQVFILK